MPRSAAGWGQFAGWLALVALLALGGVPLVWLLAKAVAGPADANAEVFGGLRALMLFSRSVAIAAGASILALVIGGGVGTLLARVRFRWQGATVALLFAVFCVSPYVLALGWLGGRLDTTTARIFLGRPWSVACVLGGSFSPLAALLIRQGLLRVSLLSEEAGFLFASPGRALRGIVVRQVVPVFLAAGLLVFGLALSDYAVASLLQVATYPVEIFLFYAGKFDPGAAARACLPLFASGLLLAGASAWLAPRVWIRRTGPTQGAGWPLSPRGRLVAILLVVAGVLVVVLPPLVGLLGSLPVGRALRRAIGSGMPAAANSVGIALVATFVCLMFAIPVSARLVALQPKRMALTSAALLLPVFVPASAFGIAWVELEAVMGRPVSRFGLVGPALCLAAHLGGAATLMLAGARRSLPLEPIEAASIVQPSAWRRWVWVEFPLLGPSVAGIAGVVFALALNDAGILVLTVPPGREVLPLRVDNLLHYGLPEEAVALAMFTAGSAAIPALAGLWVASRGRR